VLVADRVTAGEARRLANALAPALGGTPEVVTTRRVSAVRRRLRLCGKKALPARRGEIRSLGCRTWVQFARTRNRRVVAEGYGPDVRGSGRVRLRARDTAGLFYAAETFRQLLPPAVFGTAPSEVGLTAPCVHIADQPRFRWRGAMLDSGRHFFPPAD